MTETPRTAGRRIPDSEWFDTIVDANMGYPELRKRDPELYEEVTKRQQAVAACRRRAANNRRLLDKRLD